MKVYAEPRWSGPDAGEGGVRQVMEHVAPYLEALGVELVDAPDKADIVHYHMSPYANTRRWLEAHPETPVVSSCHGLYWSEYGWDRGSLAANADVIEGLRLADVVTAPTQWVANAINRGILADVRVVNHGIDMDEFTPSETPGTYALWDKTRTDSLVDPSPVIALAQRMPDQKFVMTGDPPVDLPNVMKLGRIPYEDARELTRGAGVYLAVTRETFGLATLQAMAAGVPVVGYAFGGQAEICPTREHGGLLVPFGDIDALEAALREALRLRARLGEAALRRAAEYTWQRAAEGYMAAYRDALASHASPVRVTVITTAYNAEKTINRSVVSALAELGPNDEYIVVDDASTDGTRRAIVEAKDVDPRVTLIVRDTNGYLAQARNDALACARGRYVTCLDADDALLPGALDALAGALDADRTTQIAYGKLRWVRGEDGEPEDYGHGPGESPWPPEFDLAAQMAATNFSPMPYSAMIRTPWLKRAGGWRTRCRTAEDLDLWMLLVSGGARPRRVTEAQVLTYYTSDKSMSATEPLGDWGAWYPWTGAAGQRCSPPWGLAFGPPAHLKQQWWPVSHHAEPRVAVVIPVGPGHERYVLDAVDSVQAQTLRSWECIVVDDTDHGDGYDGKHPRLPSWVNFLHNRDQGVAAARNTGLAAVTAPLVVFLDADDYLDADALEHLVATIDRNPGLAVVYPDYWERDPVPDATRQGRVRYGYTPHELPDWTCDWVERPGAIHGITAVYRTAAVREVGGFDVEAAGWEDGDLQMALAYAGHCSARLARRAYVYCRDRGTVGTWHYADREERATRIGAWLKAKYEGRKNMSCGGCSGQQGRAASPVVSAFGGDGGGAAVVLSGDMVEVVYTGGAAGDFTLRGRSSGATYRFGKGRHARKAVLREDLEFFEGNQDYRVEVEGAMQSDGPPRLAADGPPHGKRAGVA